jgi:hypothetical protein
MKAMLSAVFSLSLFMGNQLFSGCPSAFAQSSMNQTSSESNEGGQGFSDSQLSLLWSAYNAKSDTLLGKFFNNWRLETQILEEPILQTSVDDAMASLYVFLLNTDFQDSSYGYKYAVIQNQIQATVQSSAWSSDDAYVLTGLHPQFDSPNLPILIMLENRDVEMLGEFLGDWSVDKAEAAQRFFGNYVPIGTDVDYSDQKADWSLIRHWYSFRFTSDLQEALVTDETPAGPVTYTCIIGPEGNWMKVSDLTIVLDPILPTEPPAEPGPAPDPTPVPTPVHPGPFPPRPPHPIRPAPIVPAPSPKPTPVAPQHPPRPIKTPTHPTNPNNPIQIPSSRPASRPVQNPSAPQAPTQPVRPRSNSPVNQGPTAPRNPTDRPRQNSPEINPPAPQRAPAESPRAVEPQPSKPVTTESTPPASSSKSAPSPEQNKDDEQKDGPRQ